jgi:6-phosphogluconate dehydrogenase (decarboxylating)
MEKKMIGVIGIGSMGRAAIEKLGARHDLILHDASADLRRELASSGYTVAGSPREVAETHTLWKRSPRFSPFWRNGLSTWETRERPTSSNF